MKKKRKRKALSLLLAASMMFALAGCGPRQTGDGQGDGSPLSDADTKEQTQGNTADNTDGQTAMGRYVEEETDLSEQLSLPMGICKREDGSLVIMDSTNGFLVSKDDGATWESEMPDWYAQLKEQEIWISSMAMSPDGTVGVIYDSVPGDAEYTPAVKLVLPDGTQVPVELALSSDEMYIRDFIMTEDNRIIANTVSENLYEIHKDGSGELLLAARERPYWFAANGNILAMDNDANNDTMPVLYNMETEEYMEDEVLADFVHEDYNRRYYNGFYDSTMYMIPADDQVIYLIGSKGIHRHVIGGNMMEQIVDGNLSLLSNPSYTISSAVQLEGDVFLVLFSNGKLLRFVYDPDVPTVPENVLVIYSLKENDSLRQSISSFQSQNPDIFCSYQVGIADGSAMTREDAVKKLNTEIMAGTGPDLIVMDEMPLASYAGKGLLLDLTDYLQEYSASEPLFDNVIDALKIDGKAYVAPATIGIPKLICTKDALAGMTDLAGIADAVETLRAAHPGDDIIGICDADGVMKRFAPVSEPLWVTADGTISREIIKEYLEQCKRIYDTQMDGIRADIIQDYNWMSEYYLSSYGMSMNLLNWRLSTDIYDYIGDTAYLISGWVDDSYSYKIAVSVDKAEGFADSGVAPMEGQCANVFKPETLLGISAASGQVDTAKKFMDFFLSADAGAEYFGFPLNQEAFDKQFTPKAGDVSDGGVYGSMSLSNADGLSLQYVIYWPSDAQIAELKAELSSVNTAYLYDEVLENAVFKQGGAYIRGEQTLEGALDEIEKQVAIYMAE